MIHDSLSYRLETSVSAKQNEPQVLIALTFVSPGSQVSKQCFHKLSVYMCGHCTLSDWLMDLTKEMTIFVPKQKRCDSAKCY